MWETEGRQTEGRQRGEIHPGPQLQWTWCPTLLPEAEVPGYLSAGLSLAAQEQSMWVKQLKHLDGHTSPPDRLRRTPLFSHKGEIWVFNSNQDQGFAGQHRQAGRRAAPRVKPFQPHKGSFQL